MSEGFLAEVFSSIQGEGKYLGEAQLFIRFAGCPLRCEWCDTAGALVKTETCDVERSYGRRESISNPVTVDSVDQWVTEWMESGAQWHSASLTGGEPLAQPGFVGSIAKQLRVRGLKTYLETAGIHPDALASVIGWIDVIAMDIKLPSSARVKPLWEIHEQFLQIAAAKEVFIKMIVTSDTPDEEVHQGLALVSKIGRHIPVFLQPVTPTGSCRAPSPAQLIKWRGLMGQKLSSVFITPQVHRLIGVR